MIGFSEANEIVDEQEKLEFFKVFTDRYIPGRIKDVGEPTSDQVRITRVMELSLDNAAIKVRDGGAGIKDLSEFDKWVGVIPVERTYGAPEIDEKMKGRVVLPDYIEDLIK